MQKTTLPKKGEEEYFEGLRVILEQSRKEQWGISETSMAVRCHYFTVAMKYNDPKNKGIISEK